MTKGERDERGREPGRERLQRESPAMPGREKWAEDSGEDSYFSPLKRNGLETQGKLLLFAEERGLRSLKRKGRERGLRLEVLITF